MIEGIADITWIRHRSEASRYLPSSPTSSWCTIVDLVHTGVTCCNYHESQRLILRMVRISHSKTVS